MVLESLMNPFTAEHHGWRVFGLGVLYGALGLFMALWVFEEHASLVMVFLTVMGCMPLFYHSMFYEEEKDVTVNEEATLLKEHWHMIRFFLILFGGLVTAYSVLYLILPQSVSTEVFKVQTDTIASLNQQVTGNLVQLRLMGQIFINNIKVMIFCILFSVVFGAGAIFILTWNASVIAAALGGFFRSNQVQYAGAKGLGLVGSYFSLTGMSILRYAIHGIPEIAAYFIAGLAGGILSAAITKHDVGTRRFERVLLDSSNLILIAIVILLAAALIEVFITPALFSL